MAERHAKFVTDYRRGFASVIVIFLFVEHVRTKLFGEGKRKTKTPSIMQWLKMSIVMTTL